MTRLCFAIPGDIDTPTGGYVYDRQVMAHLPAFGIEVTHLPLPSGFPFPSADEVDEAARRLANVPPDAVLLIDGLAFGALPETSLMSVEAPIAAVLHHPLGLETGLKEEQSSGLLSSERAALKSARHVIVTSQATADMLTRLSFAPPPPVTVAEPGTDSSERSVGGSDVCQILSVGSVVPRKGHDVLVEALAKLPHRGWHCAIVGSLDRDRDFANRLRERVAALGLEDQVSLLGVVGSGELDANYAQADIFALPSRYEGYGMAFAGAIARGVPVVAARAGAVPDTVPSDAGLLVPPDDAEALSEALHALISDESLRRSMSDAAWAHAQALPRWETTARIVAGVIKDLAP